MSFKRFCITNCIPASSDSSSLQTVNKGTFFLISVSCASVAAFLICCASVTDNGVLATVLSSGTLAALISSPSV